MNNKSGCFNQVVLCLRAHHMFMSGSTAFKLSSSCSLTAEALQFPMFTHSQLIWRQRRHTLILVSTGKSAGEIFYTENEHFVVVIECYVLSD